MKWILGLFGKEFELTSEKQPEILVEPLRYYVETCEEPLDAEIDKIELVKTVGGKTYVEIVFFKRKK